jgi:phage antirepressor YoqD-like protein
MAEKKEQKTVTVRDLATKFKIEPKRLRAIMRANGMHAKDGLQFP